MTEEDIIREICAAIPLLCPRCRNPIRLDRIDLEGISGSSWYLRLICSGCDVCYPYVLHTGKQKVKAAKFAVLGERTIDEELDLRGGVIAADYEKHLPSLLSDFWRNEPKKEPPPPVTPA